MDELTQTNWEHEYKNLVKCLLRHRDTESEEYGDCHAYGFFIPDSTITKWCNKVGIARGY